MTTKTKLTLIVATKELSQRDVMKQYPRLVAHLICGSLGYCTPESAANIILDAHYGRKNWCEWISACFGGDPKPAVRAAIADRHYHHGFMSDYKQARACVAASLQGQGPILASWF